jgi:hypothetical protein
MGFSGFCGGESSGSASVYILSFWRRGAAAHIKGCYDNFGIISECKC